jgi:hypothetical protein
MKIIEPGHIYELQEQQAKEKELLVPTQQRLVFINKEPGTEHPGVQTQEVLRALIDRTMHCDNCLPWPGDTDIIFHLRMALVLHEARALVRKVEKGLLEPEMTAISEIDGHFQLNYHDRGSIDHKNWVGDEREHSAFPAPKQTCSFEKEKKG